jgi:ABC-type sugar transport system substrate-binding protein
VIGAGCGSDDDSSGSGSSGSAAKAKRTVGVVVLGFDNETQRLQSEGAKARGAELGVEVIADAPQTQGDAAGLSSKIDSMVVKKVDALITDSYGDQTTASAQRAIDAGVKLINFDVLIPGLKGAAAQAVYDDFAGGKAAGEGVLEDMGPGKAEVGLLTSTIYQSVKDRISGAKSAFEGTDAQVVSELSPDCDQQKAINATQDMLKANPEIKGIFAACGGAALGAAQAIELAHKTGKIVLWGLDGSADEIKAVQEGRMNGDIALDSFELGQKAAEIAVKVLDGETVPKLTKAGFIVIRKDNAEEFKKERATQAGSQ